MKEEECLLFVETCLENGSNVHEAIEDMRMIDNLLNMERIHLVVHGEVKRTASGHYRRGTTLANALDSVVSARAAGLPMG